MLLSAGLTWARPRSNDLAKVLVSMAAVMWWGCSLALILKLVVRWKW